LLVGRRVRRRNQVNLWAGFSASPLEDAQRQPLRESMASLRGLGEPASLLNARCKSSR